MPAILYHLDLDFMHAQAKQRDTLADYWQTDLPIDLGKVSQTTKRGLGYQVMGRQTYYWHRPEQDLSRPFPWLVFTYQASNFCEDRVDVQNVLNAEQCLIEQPHNALWQGVFDVFAA